MEKKSVWGNMTYACLKILKRSQVEMSRSHLHKNIIILLIRMYFMIIQYIYLLQDCDIVAFK